MNKLLTFIFSIIVASSFVSCEKNNDYEKSTINGEWTIINRYITIENDFSTESFNLNESFNKLIALDNKNFIVKRMFSQTEDNAGYLETIAINRQTGSEDRNRSGTYSISGDSLFIDDQKFEQTVSFYRLEGKILTTYTKLKKKDLDYLYGELGGDPNLIPDGAEGMLEMKEIK